jgi:hypothetical protein
MRCSYRSKGRANEFITGLLWRNRVLAYCLNLDFLAERYSLSALCASGDGSEAFSQGVLDIRHLTILRGEAALSSQNASKHEFEQG